MCLAVDLKDTHRVRNVKLQFESLRVEKTFVDTD